MKLRCILMTRDELQSHFNTDRNRTKYISYQLRANGLQLNHTYFYFYSKLLNFGNESCDKNSIALKYTIKTCQQMKTEGNVYGFTDAVNGKLAKAKTTICISCMMQTNEVQLVFSTEIQLKKYQQCIP